MLYIEFNLYGETSKESIRVKSKESLGELIGSIVGVQLVVPLHLYKVQRSGLVIVDFRVNPVGLANKSRKKSGTLTDSSGHGQTVWLSQLNRLHEHRTIHVQVSDSPRCSCQGGLLSCLIEPAPRLLQIY
jgi:hypothetical protein